MSISSQAPIEVTVRYYAEREGFHVTEYGELWGTYEREVELRAEVTYARSGQPIVQWLDKAVLEDAGLSDAEREGAEELACEAAYLQQRDAHREAV